MKTLGWGVARHAQEHLPSPADPSKPLVLTRGELAFLADFYAVDDAGRFVYRRGALQQAKGWGKSPLAAIIAVEEFVGPVVFDHWDAEGEPVGRPPVDPLVQIAALSEDQADSNVYSLVFEFLRANDHAAASALGIDEGRGRLYLRGRAGKLEAVTSAADSREGQRVTFGLLDETHLWRRANGGSAVARTIRRNAAKMGGRTLECSNAPELGLGSVAEATLADHHAGEPGILLVATRPPVAPEPTMTDDELRPLLAAVYAEAPWVSVDRLLAEVRDPATPWDEAVRYYFNAPAGGAGTLVDPSRWTALAEPPRTIPPGSRVAIGFDGSYNRDGTGVILCTADGYLARLLIIERKPSDPPDWTVPRQVVNEAVAAAFAQYDVARMLCDPWHWIDEIDDWTRAYGEERVLAYPTNSTRRFGPAIDRFRTAVAEGAVHHGGDPDLTRHVLNARLARARGAVADDGHALFTLEKPGPGRLIDAAVASVLAFEAMATAGPPREPVRFIPMDASPKPKPGQSDEEAELEAIQIELDRQAHFFGPDDDD